MELPKKWLVDNRQIINDGIAVVKLALHDLGHPAGPIYDGAWCEYEADGNLPVALDDDA